MRTGLATLAVMALFSLMGASGLAAQTVTITGSLTPFTTTAPATPSGEQSYQVEGTGLIDDIVITAPTEFEISETSGSGFTNAITLFEAGGVVAQTTIFVRYNPAAIGTHSGDISHVSASSNDPDVAASGSVPPTITNVAPNQGPAAGGTAITITGTNFDAGATVTVGGAALVNPVVVNDTTITGETPAGTGAADVVVTTAGGVDTDTGGFTYVPLPVVTSVNPNQGPSAGGQNVTITGSGFTGVTGAAGVTFDGVNAASYTVDNDTTISATTPAGTAGLIDVVVTHPVGGAGTGTDVYTYVDAPTITNVNPNVGTTAGGTTVTITGTNLIGVTAVNFDGNPGTNLNLTGAPTSITVDTPAGTAGLVDVEVVAAGGSDTEPDGFEYQTPANPAPTFTVTQNSNPITSGATVNALVGDTIAALDFEITVNDASTGDTLTLTANITNIGTTGMTNANWQGNTPQTSPTPIVATPTLGTLNTATTHVITLTASDGVNPNVVFTINLVVSTAPTITVTAPNGGNNIVIGSTFNITWTSAGAGANVEIHLSTDSGGSFPTVISASTANNGSFSWDTTGAPATTNARIRVRDIATPATLDISDANFTLALPAPAAVSLTAQNNPGNQTATPGSSRTALGFRLTETGGGSAFQVNTVVVTVNTNGAAGVGALSSVSLIRSGSGTLATIGNGGTGWSAVGNVITITFTALTSNVAAGGTGDFTVNLTFVGSAVPVPNPTYTATLAASGINGGTSVSGGPVNGNQITLIEQLPSDPLADDDDDDDSCDLSTNGGPAWPVLAAMIAVLAAGAYRRRTAN